MKRGGDGGGALLKESERLEEGFLNWGRWMRGRKNGPVDKNTRAFRGRCKGRMANLDGRSSSGVPS